MRRTTAFWDASALAPLCVEEAATRQAREFFRRFAPVAWWGSVVEVHSAIARLHREAAVTASERDGALARLSLLRDGWREILPGDAVRNLAETLLDAYALRAADSLQLAAALVWCHQCPQGRVFLCGDQRLSAAANAAGFTVAALSRPKG
ncbi:MAG: type II toxin-antitoxin system VapC family toxin [Acidobacteriaceae bacterium]